MILAAIPVKKGTHPTLTAIMVRNARAMLAACEDVEIAIHYNAPSWHVPEKIHPDYVLARSHNMATARNELLDKYLMPKYTHVLWIDADIVDYSPTLPHDLMDVRHDAVVAPMLLLDKTNLYYDTYTHIDMDGERADCHHPYFADTGALVPMSCVGGCYLAPAEMFGRYSEHGEPGMEHYHLMRNSGLEIFVTRGVVVKHANLPDYGEDFH